MISFVDLTAELEQPDRTKRRRRDPEWIFFHRLGPRFPGWEPVTDGGGILRAFTHHPELRPVFSRSPYTFAIFPGGPAAAARVDQIVELQFWTPHALSYSPRSVGIAVWGDFRHDPPTPGQLQASEDLALALLTRGPQARIMRHDEPKDPPASSNPRKRCPGELFPLHTVRAGAQARLRAGATVDWPLA